MFEPVPPIEPFYPTFEAEIEFSFEENDLTSLQTATNRLISVYLTDESPTNTIEENKTSALINLLNEVRSQNTQNF